MRFFLISLLIFSTSCIDEEAKSPTKPAPLQTTKHAIVDPGGENWIVVGGDGYVDQLGRDGEPDLISGRIVFEGKNIENTISGHDKWVVFGGGKLQALDHQGQRLHDLRDVLGGEVFRTASVNNSGWMVGGENGALHALDTSGEPTNAQANIFAGQAVQGLAFNGLAWLALSENGKTLAFNPDLNIASPEGTAVLNEGIGVVSNQNANGPSWIVFSKSKWSALSAAGVAGPLNNLPSTNISTVFYVNNSIFLGALDGKVYHAIYANTLVFNEIRTMGSAVKKFVANGEGGVLALSQNSIALIQETDGAEIENERMIVDPFVSAHFGKTNQEWVLVHASNGLLRFLKPDLSPNREFTSRLNGERVNGVAKGDEGTLLVGNAGMIQLVEDDGASISTPVQLDANVDLLDAEWNGESFLVVGKNGFTQIVSASGTPQMQMTQLDGEDIRFASWSGSFYLIGGLNRYQILRATGVSLGTTQSLADTTLYAASFDGERWLAVGEGQGGGMGYFIDEENIGTPTTVDVSIDVLRAVDFDGLEWLVGGSLGLIQRVSASGQKIGTPVSVLDGLELTSIFFNGVQYLVGGERGAVRRIGSDFNPIRTTLSVTNSGDVGEILWAKPRGFASGPCLTNDICFTGPCVGGLATGKCCDAACDSPCESCFKRDTGETDGKCLPVVSGKQSPKSGAQGCSPQPESSCGLTGFCDGQGECAFHGNDVNCSDFLCTNNSFIGAGACDGTGACSMPASESCAPYVGCSDQGCMNNCSADGNCVTGFVCDSNTCIEEEDELPQTNGGGKTPTAKDEGCSTTPNRPFPFLLSFLGLFFFARRKNKKGIHLCSK